MAESKSGRRFVIEHAEPLEWKCTSRQEAEAWVRAINRVQAMHSPGSSRAGGGEAVSAPHLQARIQELEALVETKDRQLNELKIENAALRRGESVQNLVVTRIRDEVDAIVRREVAAHSPLSSLDRAHGLLFCLPAATAVVQGRHADIESVPVGNRRARKFRLGL